MPEMSQTEALFFGQNVCYFSFNPGKLQGGTEIAAESIDNSVQADRGEGGNSKCLVLAKQI